MTQEMIQSRATVLQYGFRFAMGAFGCCRVQTEARWVQHRAFVLLFAVSRTFALCRVLNNGGQ